MQLLHSKASIGLLPQTPGQLDHAVAEKADEEEETPHVGGRHRSSDQLSPVMEM